MPRRRAAQNAASKISDIADKENDSSVKKTRALKSYAAAGKTPKEPLIKKTNGQNDENTCSTAEQRGIQTEQEKISSAIGSYKVSRSGKSPKGKKRKPKKDQGLLSKESEINTDASKDLSEQDMPMGKKPQPKEKTAKEDTESKGKSKTRHKKESSQSNLHGTDAIMTVDQSEEHSEPRNKKSSNRKTVPNDDEASEAKPKTRTKKDSKINPKEAAKRENIDKVELEDVKKAQRKARPPGRKQETDNQDTDLLMKPDLCASNDVVEPLQGHIPKGDKKATQAKTKRVGQTKKLKSTEQIEEDIVDLRSQISQWWDKCYYGKEQRNLCLPFFDENLTSSNLTALKKEETKLRKFYEKNRHIFDNISLQRDDKQNPTISNAGDDYEAKILAKDKELEECRILHKEIFHQLESQLEEKENRIYKLERNIEEMKSHHQTIEQAQENDLKMTTPRTTKECLNSTYTKESDRKHEKRKCQSAANIEDFHEVNVLYEFCQKQKKTIRNLEREIEQMQQEKEQASK